MTNTVCQGECNFFAVNCPGELSNFTTFTFKYFLEIIPRDALQGHRRGKNPVAYVFFIPHDAPVGHRRGNNPVEYVILFPRDAPVGHRRGNNPVEYVFIIFYSA